MPRKKVIPIADPDEPEQPKGEALPALEDFVRKMSNTFSEEIVLPEVIKQESEDEDDGE